jgi:Catalytic LigB subunit of aromatic ring-opening dioxygenase
MDVIGLGMSHYPYLQLEDARMTTPLRRSLDDPSIPAAAKQVSAWPESMRAEWGSDEGLSAAVAHRAAMRAAIGQVRRTLDEFRPDVVLVWGDDQYENFREDVVPPFAVLAYEDMEVLPWQLSRLGPDNVWGEPADFRYPVRGAREIGADLVASLLDSSFDISYAYKPLHWDGIGHAFLNPILFLDYERTGFPYPVLPFSVNCYGRRLIGNRGTQAKDGGPVAMDPPSPSPARCLELGRAVGRWAAESRWRVALVASSGWSHAFLTDKNSRLWPDVESDRSYFDAMIAGDLDRWHNATLPALEESGQQEMLNWFPLVGAMAELGKAPTWSDFLPTHIFNSSKVTVIFK